MPFSYLLEGNILAARTFLSHFISQLISTRPEILAEKSPLQIGTTSDEIFITTDQVLNFLQLAIRTCQRSQGDKNKTVREALVRLCGTYQSKGGLMASPPMRSVRLNYVFDSGASRLPSVVCRPCRNSQTYTSVYLCHVDKLLIPCKICFHRCLVVQNRHSEKL